MYKKNIYYVRGDKCSLAASNPYWRKKKKINTNTKVRFT